jgi:acetyl-CoA acetyltransferase
VGRVAIVGVGQTVHSSERRDVDVSEMVLEAIDEALADAGVDLGDIENAVTASMDIWDGRTISNMSIAEVVGSYRKSEARVCGDAIQAVMYQLARISTGTFRIGLVTAHCKETSGNIPDIEVTATDPFHQRRLGFDGSTIAGLTADMLATKGAYDEDSAARVVVEARTRGRANPKVEDLPAVTVEDVLSAPTLAAPLRTLDRAPDRDGACAFVVVSEDVVDDLAAQPVWVTGAGSVSGRFWSDGDPTSIAHLEAAHDRTARMAGWGGDEVDLVEISAQFSFQHLLFAPVFGKDPLDTAVNSSGGWLAGNPFVVTGAARVAECVEQIRGTAGARQIGNVERAYAHGIHGLAAQTHSLLALEGGD